MSETARYHEYFHFSDHVIYQDMLFSFQHEPKNGGFFATQDEHDEIAASGAKPNLMIGNKNIYIQSPAVVNINKGWMEGKCVR